MCNGVGGSVSGNIVNAMLDNVQYYTKQDDNTLCTYSWVWNKLSYQVQYV